MGVGGLAVDSSDNVYVSDIGNYRIQKFTSNGLFLTQWGSKGDLPGEFIYPDVIAVDEAGNVYVTSGYDNRIQKFTSNGLFLTQWGNEGNKPGEIDSPVGLVVDKSGNVYVSDWGNRRVQVFSSGLPTQDIYSGLVLNGTMDQTPALKEWTYGGSLPVSRSTNASQGTYSLQLAQPVAQTDQGEGQAWAHQTFYVRPEWDRPMLSFKYNMYVNDIMDYSDFFVAIQDGVGLNHLTTVVRDGYQPCVPGTAPAAGTNLGWRSVNYDLSAYKGQHIRLVFSNRNLWPISWGIWTYVDDVKVVDAGPLPPPAGSERLYLPAVSKMTCDPVTKSGVKSSEEPIIILRPPVD
jgi:hypothetical protein